jgi:hypothetical protein
MSVVMATRFRKQSYFCVKQTCGMDITTVSVFCLLVGPIIVSLPSVPSSQYQTQACDLMLCLTAPAHYSSIRFVGGGSLHCSRLL